ncbi:MAG: hypothetical protein GY943_32585 [Chloroflexi bacterium]|nr:hypothetical protein [Chloroflexota bacterium]
MQSGLYAYRRFEQSIIERAALIRRWKQLSVIIGVILLSATLGIILPSKFHIIVIALPFAVMGLFVVLRWPPLGLVLIIIGGLTKFTAIPLIDLPAAGFLGLTGLWIFRMLAYDKEFKMVITPSVTAVLFYGLVVILSFAVGQFPWFPVSGAPMVTQIGGAFIFLASFCAFILVAQQVRDIGWIKWMVYPFIAFAGVFAILAIVPGGRKMIRQFYSVRATGGSLFWLWAVAMSASQALFNKKLNWPARIAIGSVALGILYVGIVPGRSWVSGWVPPIVAFVSVVWIGAPQAALPLSILALGGMATQYESIYGLVAGDNEYSTVSRLDAWRVMGEIIKVNPVLGVGPSNYYFYTALFNILGFYVQFNSHNNYVDILAQTGFVGLFCFFWIVFSVARLGLRLLKQVPQGGFTQAFIVGSLGGLSASVLAGMLGDWVLPFYYNIGINGLRASGLAWLYWGALVAIDQMLKLGKPLD